MTLLSIQSGSDSHGGCGEGGGWPASGPGSGQRHLPGLRRHLHHSGHAVVCASFIVQCE